jgi:hypothetical protein
MVIKEFKNEKEEQDWVPAFQFGHHILVQGRDHLNLVNLKWWMLFSV